MSRETPSVRPPLLTGIQSLRGAAALLVVFSHLWVIEAKYTAAPITGPWMMHGIAGVDLFFVISGFIMVYVTQNTPRGAGGVGAFALARITRIYPLYWVVSAALLLVYLARPDMVFAGSTEAAGEPSLWKSFALWPDIQNGVTRPPLLAVGWTLIHEMFFYAVFAFSLFLSRRWLPAFLGIWAAIFFAGNLAGFEQLPSAARIFFHPLTAEFLLGALAALLGLKLKGKGAGLALILAPLVCAGLALTVPPPYDAGWPRVAVYGVPAALLVYAAFGLEFSGRVFSRTLIALGDWSYALYLTHVLTLSLIGRIWRALLGEGAAGPWDNLAFLALLIAASLIVAALTHHLIERPLMVLARKLRKAA